MKNSQPFLKVAFPYSPLYVSYPQATVLISISQIGMSESEKI
jgi:hypothetical protein